jgi:hypothetical protein
MATSIQPCPRAGRFRFDPHWLIVALLLALTVGLCVSSAVEAGTLRVRVTDGTNGAPLGGAYVQVGQLPGNPFPQNWGLTNSEGVIQFSDPFLVGPQTVTAGSDGFSLLTVIDAAVDSVSLALHPSTSSGGVAPPRAQISGTVTGIAIQNNDGNLDVGMVYPSVRLADLLSQRTLPFEVPSDTVNFPLVGPTVLPGNVVVPTQTEGFILTFSKPNYHFYVPDARTYDFLVVSGRMPILALSQPGLPLNLLTMRETGAERNVPVNGDRTLTVNSDLNLTPSLTVQAPEAPPGSTVFATAVADLPASAHSILFDAKSALRDTLTALHLSGFTPAGDLADAVPYIAGYYGDSSRADTYQSGRVDRSPLTLPATRTLGGFYLLPELTQIGDGYAWSDVSRPGITPNPTWAIATFRTAPLDPADTTVPPLTAWEAWIPADQRIFRLPLLAPGAPGGLPDPSQTPEADKLLWDLWVADPSGSVGSVLTDAFATLTRWSRRTVEIFPPVPDVREVGLGTVSVRSLKFRLAPNPGNGARDVLWERPLAPNQMVSWTLLDPAGRKLLTGTFGSSGSVTDRRALKEVEHLPTGVYWIKMRAGNQSGSTPLIVAR